MNRFTLAAIFGILSAILFYGAHKGCNHPLERREVRPCKVLSKVSTDAGYKVSAQWILILESDSRRFDITVSPTTYWEARVGDVLYFSLTERQMGNHSKPWIEILTFVSFIAGIVFVIFLIAALCGAFK